METPKEKAIRLYTSHKENITYYGQQWEELEKDAIIHALLTVEEITTVISNMSGHFTNELNFWYEVKEELEKM